MNKIVKFIVVVALVLFIVMVAMIMTSGCILQKQSIWSRPAPVVQPTEFQQAAARLNELRAETAERGRINMMNAQAWQQESILRQVGEHNLFPETFKVTSVPFDTLMFVYKIDSRMYTTYGRDANVPTQTSEIAFEAAVMDLQTMAYPLDLPSIGGREAMLLVPNDVLAASKAIRCVLQLAPNAVDAWIKLLEPVEQDGNRYYRFFQFASDSRQQGSGGYVIGHPGIVRAPAPAALGGMFVRDGTVVVNDTRRIQIFQKKEVLKVSPPDPNTAIR